jgi:hypothetical protein
VDFLARINDADRAPNSPDPAETSEWEIGTRDRRRGSVQSDRLDVEAAALAGDLLVGVFPAGGGGRTTSRPGPARKSLA